MTECVGRHQKALLVNVVQENRLQTPFKRDNVVKALIKTPNCEKLVLYFSEKVRKLQHYLLGFFGFQ